LKIVQVCNRYYPYTGGIETLIRQISERLVTKGFEVEIFSTDPFKILSKEETINNVKILRFNSIAPTEAYYLPYPEMLSAMLIENMDILHAHGIGVFTTFLAYIVHKIHKDFKFIISPYYHGRGHTNIAQLLWKPYRPLAKKILKDADAIIINSRAQRTSLRRTFGLSSKFFKVYDGVNLKKIKEAEPFVINENMKILLYVGRLENYKGVQIPIASMKYLPENYHFYIVGDGRFRLYLENLVKSLNLEKRIHFLGFQPDNIVYRWYKTAHLFLHLSSVESFGMTCIESLAAGTPVIANDDGFGLRETIDIYPDYIMVYRKNNDAISKLVDLVIKAVEMKPIDVDVSHFSWDCIAERMSDIYTKEI